MNEALEQARQAAIERTREWHRQRYPNSYQHRPKQKVLVVGDRNWTEWRVIADFVAGVAEDIAIYYTDTDGEAGRHLEEAVDHYSIPGGEWQGEVFDVLVIFHDRIGDSRRCAWFREEAHAMGVPVRLIRSDGTRRWLTPPPAES